jgi:hypothetical protein
MTFKMDKQQDNVDALKAQIEQLQRQWPKHSTPPALLQQLDELEEALKEAKANKLASDHDDSAKSASST